jgi:LmbE family N-acetylglucosaminyl deacetylase
MSLKFSSADRILILAPHPDDESLAAGGLIQRALKAGAKVRVVFATDGDNNPWPQRFVERKLKIRRQDRARWGRRRRKEALAAMARLGLAANCARFLALPDQGITELLLKADNAALSSIADELTEWRPTLLVAPSNTDAHPDHSAFFVLVQLAIGRLKKEQTAPRVLRYIVHAPRSHAARGKVTLHLRDEEIEAKREAILCHESQMILSRKRFTRYATATEIFFTEPVAVAVSNRHPVAEVSLHRGALRLELRLRSSSRPQFTGRVLFIALESVTEGSVRWALPMPSSSRVVQIENAHDGEPLRRAVVRINGNHAEVSVPIAPLQPIRRLFVKLERGVFMYDRAGWREIPVAAASEEVSGLVAERALVL